MPRLSGLIYSRNQYFRQTTARVVDCAVKQKIDQKPNAVDNGSVMTRISMSCSPMPAIAVAGTIAVIRFAVTILVKAILGIGKIAPSAAKHSIRKCTFITGPMSTIFEKLRIHQPINHLDAGDAAR